jgi:hypothetical protein
MATYSENNDRRRKARMDDPVPVSVRGMESGQAYRFETVARNIGAGGLCALAPRPMKSGERLSLRIRFVRAGCKPVRAPEVAMRGLVVRVEDLPAGFCVFAVSFLVRSG